MYLGLEILVGHVRERERGREIVGGIERLTWISLSVLSIFEIWGLSQYMITNDFGISSLFCPQSYCSKPILHFHHSLLQLEELVWTQLLVQFARYINDYLSKQPQTWTSGRCSFIIIIIEKPYSETKLNPKPFDLR